MLQFGKSKSARRLEKLDGDLKEKELQAFEKKKQEYEESPRNYHHSIR